MIATGKDMHMGGYLIWFNARTRLNAVIEQPRGVLSASWVPCWVAELTRTKGRRTALNTRSHPLRIEQPLVQTTSETTTGIRGYRPCPSPLFWGEGSDCGGQQTGFFMVHMGHLDVLFVPVMLSLQLMATHGTEAPARQVSPSVGAGGVTKTIPPPSPPLLCAPRKKRVEVSHSWDTTRLSK